MYHELKIRSPMQETAVFLQEGFYQYRSHGIIHSHNYAEIHLIYGGNAVFHIGSEKRELESGNMLMIPPNTSHTCIWQDDFAMHTAFQIDLAIDHVVIRSVDEQILSAFFDEIKACERTQDHTKLSAWMSLLCCYFYDSAAIRAKEVTDYGFLIHEFFSMNYNKDIHLCDLAERLHLSERQAERLVVEKMGKPFGQVLTRTRITVAKQLIGSSDISLREIAEYVGYRSYAGFWKAMKKYLS